MKTILALIFTLFSSMSLAEAPAATSEVVCNNSSGCRDDDPNWRAADLSADRLARQIQARFESVARLAQTQQTEYCANSITGFNKGCQARTFETISAEIAEINEVITARRQILEEKVAQLASIEGPTRIEAQDVNTPTSEIQSLIDRATELVAEIEDLKSTIDAAKVFLAEKNVELTNLNNTCAELNSNVQTVCQDPKVGVVMDTIVISGHTEGQTIMAGIVPAREVESFGELAAAAELEVTENSLPTPEIATQRLAFDWTYYSTSRIGGNTVGHLRSAETFVDESAVYAADELAQANNIINSLRTLLPDQTPNTGTCTLTMQATGACSATTPDPNVTRPQQRPPNLSRNTVPVPTPAPRGGGAPGGGGGAPPVNGQGLIDDVNQGPGYGGSPSPGGGGTDVAGRGGNAPGAGGLMNTLGGLGSMFGKTGGGFGSEGYRSSSNGRSASGGSIPPNRSRQGYGLPNQNVDFNPSSRPNSAGAPLGQPRAFNGGLGSNGQSGGFGGGAAAGGGMPASGGGSAGGGSSGSGQKPGLLSRLMGKKRDKTMFGKADSSGGGGGFNNAKASPRAGLTDPYDGSSNVALDENGRRIFDASKYAPSQAAQDRAYARATGRRIASTVQRPNSGAMDWPSDISKDRNGNMFMKVRLSHTSFINNSSARP
jgi:hypothetical protein